MFHPPGHCSGLKYPSSPAYFCAISYSPLPFFSPLAYVSGFLLTCLPKCLKFRPSKITSQVSTLSVETSIKDPQNDIESLFSSDTVEEIDRKRGNRQSNTGASGISSSVKLENISKSYKGVTVLKDVSWEVKKCEKVGLVGEFEVSMTRTVREEFMSSFKEEMDISERRAQAVDLDEVDAKASKLMSELGFSLEDSDRLVASFSSSWQMRMSLGKILLQEPDFFLLDEPTSHLDLDIIEWLEGYLNKQDVPMVIISHDRAFLDQLCTKIVETDMGVPRTFEGNYSQYVEANASWVESQYAAWEMQQKEIEQTKDLISRLGAGANSGRASSAEKSKKSWQARHTGIKIVQQIAILIGCAVLPHLKSLVEIIEHGIQCPIRAK
ncbi:ABC transporter F family member 5 [Hibiscus syriacus]|uniref:ABC transporter F family member 5 n=1 Tax=Hibiscus syriacus TaxID=106335 RepID=A0A6A2YME6_HIBSY|nr:ABC transporter F family member 5 [Hibiscus syriacus]